MRQDNETPVQVAIVQWLETQHPKWIVHHCKMEINKSGVAIRNEIAKAKRKGSKPGFPDLLVLPWSNIGPLFFEVKAEGNYADKTQKAMHARLEALGYRVAVVRSVDDVREKLAGWGIWTNDRKPAPPEVVHIPMKGTIS